MWTGGDISARYERSRRAAEQKVTQDKACTKITHTDASQNTTQNSQPYNDETQNATTVQCIPAVHQQPAPPGGKAQYQAAGSRQQVLDDTKDGGFEVLKDEAREEREAQTTLKRSPRRRTTSAVSQADNFKGLRDRIAGSMHGRAGGILGMESSR